MGRIRDGYESQYLKCVSDEVVELFGVDDCILYRYLHADNVNTRDPLYDEPVDTLRYRSYKIKCIFTDYRDEFVPGAEGPTDDYTNSIYVSLGHLIGAGVLADDLREYISEGDLIEIHYQGEAIVYDIKQVNRNGYINNSDQFTGYDLECKRSTKYIGERYQIPVVN